ncbi:LysR substrate-binding domain-containing protein [Desulfurivibrio alkaliphilus]|uniref:Transcriptional regulator, LysR family n=1 Tax=Desulfurivibrio alkaliphilus (strain DSM 19089 / UNIQEM U267 / AHT2) TaxID=589865 RepID=D6Z0Y2_DESAT|nr:LysR substrate-binding domain-containing protein [Desulfurivibrio alkaliphilus]ADH87242.1 transcriptional regulator, LysR family [Desulfurivibrio alkaliphilus AHT 2]
MAITLRQLEIFVAVAETCQVTRASSKLHLTQSAVSMALSELESQLDGPLFDRQGRSLIINDRGRYLLPLAKDVLGQVGNIETLLGEKSGEVAGVLKIVASSTIGNYVLPYFIGVFKKQHPAASLEMLVCNTRHAETLIAEGEADLGFVEGEVSNEQVMVTPWFEDELLVVAGPEHPFAAKSDFVIPDDLEYCEWIMREKGSGTAQVFKKKLGCHLPGLRVAMELGHTEAIKKAVEAGVGVACLSSLTVCREVEEGWLASLSVKGVDMWRTLRIIHYKKRVMTNLMREFVAFCSLIKESSHGCACLASPWILHEILHNRSLR